MDPRRGGRGVHSRVTRPGGRSTRTPPRSLHRRYLPIRQAGSLHARHVPRTVRSATASIAATSRADSTRYEPPAVPGRGVAHRLQAVTSLLARYRMMFSPGPSPPLDRGGAGRSSCEPATPGACLTACLIGCGHAFTCRRARERRDETTGETITHGEGSLVVRARHRPRLTRTTRPALTCSRRCL
jgi:hypothetical protein